MGEAKRRRDLGLPPWEKNFVLPKFKKEEVKQKVRNTLKRYPIIPYVFYDVAIAIFLVGILRVIKYYKKVLSFSFLLNDNMGIWKDCKSFKIQNFKIRKMIRFQALYFIL